MLNGDQALVQLRLKIKSSAGMLPGKWKYKFRVGLNNSTSVISSGSGYSVQDFPTAPLAKEVGSARQAFHITTVHINISLLSKKNNIVSEDAMRTRCGQPEPNLFFFSKDAAGTRVCCYLLCLMVNQQYMEIKNHRISPFLLVYYPTKAFMVQLLHHYEQS